MFKLFSTGFWEAVARIILRNKIAILILIVCATIFFGSQWKHMRFTYTEANLLPDDHEVNVTYNRFLEIFGEEGNLIVIGVKDTSLYKVKNLNAWNNLSDSFKAYPQVETVISIKDLQKLVKNQDEEKFELEPFIKDSIQTLEQISSLEKELFERYPFYDNFLFNKASRTVRTVIYLKKDIVNTPERKDFIIDDLISKIEHFEAETGLDVRVSGMPYIRTLNSQNIIDEIGLFIVAALLVTSLIFFLFLDPFELLLFRLLWSYLGLCGPLAYWASLNMKLPYLQR